MRNVCNVYTNLVVAVGKLARMKSIVDVLTADGVDTADEQTTQVFAISPAGILSAGGHAPVMALLGQAVEDSLGERPLLHIPFEKQSLRLGGLGFQLTE